MLFADFNVKPKTLKIISLSLTLIGIILILASAYIGNFAVRTAMVAILVISLCNFKKLHHISASKEKINNLLVIAAAAVIFYKPDLTMFIIGISALIISLPVLYKLIITKEFSDILKLAASSAGALFSVYCIVNSRAALNTAIIIIGIAFVVLGCLILYEALCAD